MADDTLFHALLGILDHLDGEDGHAVRVTRYAVRIAKELGLSEADTKIVEQGAFLHDLGKVGVPASVLRKAGPLDEKERAMILRHPDVGFGLLQRYPDLRQASLIVLHHHERWDGKGYPQGLEGEAIILGARIFSVADTMDAILSNRPYRPARGFDVVVDEVTTGSGFQFDPKVVEAFLRIPKDGF